MYPKIHYPVQELNKIQQLIELGRKDIHHEVLETVHFRGYSLPLYLLKVGDAGPDKPALALTGGIHGLEKIGTQVILAFLESMLKQLTWDDSLREELKQVQLYFLPAINPAGMIRKTRANGNGVDLMRNAPLDAETRVPWLLGGQRITTRFPWFRGDQQNMEPEAVALCKFVRERLFSAPFSMALDCHSGFGFNDQLWFPYAYSKEPIHHLAEIFALRNLLFETYPNHVYTFEPQSRVYTTHGDLWDYLYLEAQQTERMFMPLTMEMGSWQWIKKNPRQLTQLLGFFHPVLPHRLRRVLRRHLTFIDFLKDAVRSYHNWLPTPQQRAHYELAALALWYDQNPAKDRG